jgi:cob(I)alamin adenosyltransferase
MVPSGTARERGLPSPRALPMIARSTMVRLDRIYTRGGDEGLTSLGDGTRVPKHHPRVVAYGTVDELSSVLGLVLAHGAPEPLRSDLLAIQNDLFDVGADLCVPGTGADRLRIDPRYTLRLEQLIDRENEPLAPLKSFILPGGTVASAWLHLARNVCRRAERLVTELCALPGEAELVNPEVVKYLNRLSDLLFVLARAQNDSGVRDVLWVPGRQQGA